MTAADSITVLRTFGPLATKTLRRAASGWQVEGYDRAKHFAGRTLGFVTIQDLYRELTRLARCRTVFVVRAAICDHVDRGYMLRRLHADAATGEPATLEDVPRRTAAFDFDGTALPSGVDPLDPLELGDWLRGRMPPEFHDAAAIVQLTSSAGIKPGGNARLWVMFDRPLLGSVVEGWLRACGVQLDPVTLLPAEPIYVASPLFVDGEDFMPQRWALLPGLQDVVELPDPLPQAPYRSATLGTGELRRGIGLDGFVARLGDGEGRVGFRRPIFSAVCSMAAKLGPDDLQASAESLRQRLAAAVASAPQREGRGKELERYLSPEHFGEMVAWACAAEAGKRQAERQGRVLAALVRGARA